MPLLRCFTSLSIFKIKRASKLRIWKTLSIHTRPFTTITSILESETTFSARFRIALQLETNPEWLFHVHGNVLIEATGPSSIGIQLQHKVRAHAKGGLFIFRIVRTTRRKYE